MIHIKLVKLLLELEAYEVGSEGMFDEWLDESVWKETHGTSAKQHKEIVSKLSEDEARHQVEWLLDSLVDYDEEHTGMFDKILVDYGRKRNKHVDKRAVARVGDKTK